MSERLRYRPIGIGVDQKELFPTSCIKIQGRGGNIHKSWHPCLRNIYGFGHCPNTQNGYDTLKVMAAGVTFNKVVAPICEILITCVSKPGEAILTIPDLDTVALFG